MAGLAFDLYAAAVSAPGLESLAALREACRSGQPPTSSEPTALPAPALLPSNERRRASRVVRLTLGCIEQVLRDSPLPVDTMRAVFATDEGTGEICQQMLDALAVSGQVSPLVFSNSVHNAPAGYFGIAWRTQQSTTVVSLGIESFASGLFCAVTEAMTTDQSVLLVAYDPAMTAPLDELLPVTDALSTAWVIGSGLPAAPAPAPVPLARFALELGPASAPAATPLPAWLPAHWSAASSSRALAALGLLDAGPGAALRLPLGAQQLTLRRIEDAS